MLDRTISAVNNILWGEWKTLVVILVLAGIWFTIKLSAVQLVHFSHMFHLMRRSLRSSADGISSFQALCTSLSARVGTGNLVGVAIAISLGGSGAIFWMWVIAFLGMATGFAESLLAQVYKVRNRKGEFRGGPAYYIKQGLNKPWLAILFSICIFMGYGLFFSAFQANNIASAIEHSYGVNTQTTGLVVMLVAGVIVVGGLRSVARFAEWAVPFMGLAYVLTALFITIINIELLPAVLSDIVLSAFGLQEAGSGALGAAIKNGIQRGLFSNEAGSGSAPHAAAGARPEPNHPATQGYIQMMGVFFDTIILCTCTAMIILLAQQTGLSGSTDGIQITQAAMEHHIGSLGGDFVALALTLFAFTSVVANFAYAQSNLRIFKLDNAVGNTAYFLVYLAMVYWGASATLTQVLAAADMALGLMTVVNLTALILLTPTIVSVSKHYQQKFIGDSEILNFKESECVIQGTTESDAWR